MNTSKYHRYMQMGSAKMLAAYSEKSSFVFFKHALLRCKCHQLDQQRVDLLTPSTLEMEI